jgi:hypothetical protein
VQELEDHQQQALQQLVRESQQQRALLQLVRESQQQRALLQLAQESQPQQALQQLVRESQPLPEDQQLRELLQLGQVLGWQPEQQPPERREHQIRLLHPRLRQ